MDSTPLPTPYDIIAPSSPPFEVGAMHWIGVIALFIIAWLIALPLLKRSKRSRALSRYSLPPLAKEVEGVGKEFLNTGTKESLHLFIALYERLTGEYPELLEDSETTSEFKGLKRARYAEELGEELSETVKKLMLQSGRLRE